MKVVVVVEVEDIVKVVIAVEVIIADKSGNVVVVEAITVAEVILVITVK